MPGTPPSGEDPGAPAPPRIWTVVEANARLDGLKELLPQLKSWVVRLSKVHDELERLRGFWGREVDAADNPDREMKLRLEDEWKRLGQRLEREVLGLHDEGIEVKDLETGLVDFYARRDGDVVFLCWQRGESEVSHWHTLTGGYRTRKPLAEPRRASGGHAPARAARRAS